MTTAFDQEHSLRRSDGTAANDDHVSHSNLLIQARSNPAAHTQAAHSTAQTGGWDAYEVWRRLIKDARDRRAGRTFPA